MATYYRPDIDGLRAIAVLSVILYHANITVFSGGYVGVDIFFVISGFLITRLLISEIEKNGQVDFASFYLRRVRRLLPAFIFTTVCSSFFAIWLLSPSELMSYGGTLLHSVLSVSNIYFYTQSGYFDTTSSLKPLLHTWSLSVEEQFYLIWPFLLLIVSRKKWLPPLFTILIGLISLYFAQNFVAEQTSAVFFLMPFRIFEFAIGASLVWLMQIQFSSQIQKEFLLWIGFLLIAYSVFGYSEKTLFPGITALLPCIGAALCIYAGDAKITGKILSNKLFVGIGLASYSLYLAHWPVIVFYKTKMSNTELHSLEPYMLIGISFAVAIFMYFVIEKPFRRNTGQNGRFLFGCAMLTLLLSYTGASMWATDGWGWRKWSSVGAISSKAVSMGKEERFQTRRRICENKGWEVCDNPVQGKINALILGDSHAVDALNAFERIYPNHNYSMSELGGCPPYKDIEKITLASHPDRQKCKELNKTRFDPTYLRKFDYIVINVLFGWYSPEHLYEYLKFLKANNIRKVIVLGDYLTLKREMHELLNQYGYNEVKLGNWIDGTSVNEAELKQRVNDAGFLFLSKRESLCKNDKCELFDSNRVPFTYDMHHLSYEFAVRLAVNSVGEINQYFARDGVFGTKNGFATSPAVTNLTGFFVKNWGPQITNAGVVPNIQPGGGMGIWIEVSKTQGVGALEVLFDGQVASEISVQDKLITVSIPPKLLAKPGKYDLVIREVLTNKSIPVGVFEVHSPR